MAAKATVLISLLALVGNMVPAQAKAGILDDLFGISAQAASQNDLTTSSVNVQTMQLPTPAHNIDPSPAVGGGDVTVVDSSALLPDEGPSGTLADIEKPQNSTITTYIVKPGDTLSSIAAMFHVTTGTILSANDLPKGSTLQIGQDLVILPVTGIRYTVKKGDTIESIAAKNGGDVSEIEAMNNVDNSTLAVGSQIIIPNGEAQVSVPAGTTHRKTGGVTGPSSVFANNWREPAHNVGAPGTADEIAYYIAPLSHYIVTQKIHGYNAVDLAAPTGTPIMAAAAGDVIVARSGGWNGGYGSYVVIQHDNGSQTLYAHMSVVDAYDGEHVQQGEVIGEVGATGEATGPHVHFEIRNGIRNPFTQSQ
jgi:murein DD-endopeptidase MepM/ murein hydrolase activator NlpD